MARCGLDECDLYGGCLYDCPVDKPKKPKHDKIMNAQKALLNSLSEFDNVNEETKALIDEVQALGGNAFVVTE